MRAISKLFAASAAAVALAGFATSANAITYIADWTENVDESITLNFGDDDISDPTGPGVYFPPADANDGASTHEWDGSNFTDTFTFTLPSGMVGFAGISIGFDAISSLTFTSVTFNGVELSRSDTPVGDGGNIASYFSMTPVFININEPQVLVVKGTGGENASWDGSGTFVPVPEPGAWALMILGFAGAGSMIRSRRRAVAAA